MWEGALLKMNIKSRSGFTLAETAVALFLLCTVTAASLTLMLTVTKADSVYEKEQFALCVAENVYSCMTVLDAEGFTASLVELGFGVSGGDYVFSDMGVTCRVTLNDGQVDFSALDGKDVLFSFTGEVKG